MPQVIMVVEILVAERNPEHALADERRHLMLNQLRAAGIRKAGGKALDEADRPVRGAKQQRTGIRGHRPAIESRLHRTALNGCKTKQVCATLCSHRGAPRTRKKSLSHNNFG